MKLATLNPQLDDMESILSKDVSFQSLLDSTSVRAHQLELCLPS